ncbi:MAG: hypothetical protein IPJ38_12400 [Dechloromonas sp.]|uniref:Uncharacterized protein n=1 Tax=Candidatus Dechloromonas phosphorivorans TaxID=2899244 RepID=A0A935N239_9RHOO|nr:hypothetical protein [Candidatus Dechloromonas phosphorivorans]
MARSWKYGERACRHCQLDVGPRRCLLAHAAALLGWEVVPLAVDGEATEALSRADRANDFPILANLTEVEEPETLLAIRGPARARRPRHRRWATGCRPTTGKASRKRIDPSPGYRWPASDQVAAASRESVSASEAISFGPCRRSCRIRPLPGCPNHPPAPQRPAFRSALRAVEARLLPHARRRSTASASAVAGAKHAAAHSSTASSCASTARPVAFTCCRARRLLLPNCPPRCCRPTSALPLAVRSLNSTPIVRRTSALSSLPKWACRKCSAWPASLSRHQDIASTSAFARHAG